MVNKNIILTLFLALSLSFLCSGQDDENYLFFEIDGVYLLESYLLDLQVGASHIEALRNFSSIPYQEGVRRPIIMAIHNDHIFMLDHTSLGIYEIEIIEEKNIITKNIPDGYGSRRFQIVNNGIILNGGVTLVKISDYKTNVDYKIYDDFENYKDGEYLAMLKAIVDPAERIALSHILKIILMNGIYRNDNGDTFYQSESGYIQYKNSEYFLQFSHTGERARSYDLAIEIEEDANARYDSEGQYSRKSFYFKIDNNTCYIYQLYSLTGRSQWNMDIVYIEVDRLEKISVGK
jgi:hypothetical protein